jgi:hypothetical protein
MLCDCLCVHQWWTSGEATEETKAKPSLQELEVRYDMIGIILVDMSTSIRRDGNHA